jgi:hypothetical protein
MDILEFFDRKTDKKINAHFVKDIFAWTNGSYRVKSAWWGKRYCYKTKL